MILLLELLKLSYESNKLDIVVMNAEINKFPFKIKIEISNIEILVNYLKTIINTKPIWFKENEVLNRIEI